MGDSSISGTSFTEGYPEPFAAQFLIMVDSAQFKEWAILVMVGLIGYACSSIFPIIYSKAITARPEKANEISGLMITGVFGGAVVPPLMGITADSMNCQAGSLIIITVCLLYLTYLAFGLKTGKKQR